MAIPSQTTTQTSSLISIGISISPVDEVRDEFNEYFVVSLGEYRYIKANISMVKRGKKRGIVQNDMNMTMVNEVVWTQQSSDPQSFATDATFVLGDFKGASLDVVNSLNREFDKQKVEIVNLKE